MRETEVLIIGGGISGLHSAYALQKKGIRFLLVEARERFGGRILSNSYEKLSLESGTNKTDQELIDTHTYKRGEIAFDMGPSWFWPGQTRMETLVQELGLSDDVFMQYAQGDAVYEDEQGHVRSGIAGISMEGSYRLKSGMQQITQNLIETIPTDNLMINSIATKLEYKDEFVLTEIKREGKQQQVKSQYVLFALPPRVALKSIEFIPKLVDERADELNGLATWMAGHAKLVATYETPFWREQGLSGDAMSQLGPLREIHDASPNKGGPYALFGFFGVPASYRKENENEMRELAIEQLVRIFGENAAKPLSVTYQDWAREVFTATDKDQQMPTHHTMNLIGDFVEQNWDKRLIWSGTETAGQHQRNNGYLEGAIESSIRSDEFLVSKLS